MKHQHSLQRGRVPGMQLDELRNRRKLGASCLHAMLPVLLLCAAGAVPGCNSLPAGELKAFESTLSTQPARPPVVLLRGWRDLWSDGIDQLSAKLKEQGIDSAVFKQSQSSDVADALVLAAKSKSVLSPVVLIGFSYGADDSVDIARRLNAVGQQVDLLILIDPVTPRPIPANVRRCVNFYQSNGAWDLFPWLRGVAVSDDKGRSGRATENIDLRVKPELLDPDTSHKTIAGSAKVHAEIIRLVKQALAQPGM